MGLLDTQELQITCPNCKTKIKKSLGWFKQKGSCCPGCKVTFQTDQLSKDLEPLDRKLSEVVRAFKKIGK